MCDVFWIVEFGNWFFCVGGYLVMNFFYGGVFDWMWMVFFDVFEFWIDLLIGINLWFY